MRMVERGDRFGLAFETLFQVSIVGELLRQDFDSDRAFQPRIAGAVHFAHAARTQQPDDLIRPEFRAGLQSHLEVDYNLRRTTEITASSRAKGVGGNQELIRVK